VNLFITTSSIWPGTPFVLEDSFFLPFERSLGPKRRPRSPFAKRTQLDDSRSHEGGYPVPLRPASRFPPNPTVFFLRGKYQVYTAPTSSLYRHLLFIGRIPLEPHLRMERHLQVPGGERSDFSPSPPVMGVLEGLNSSSARRSLSAFCRKILLTKVFGLSPPTISTTFCS